MGSNRSYRKMKMGPDFSPLLPLANAIGSSTNGGLRPTTCTTSLSPTLPNSRLLLTLLQTPFLSLSGDSATAATELSPDRNSLDADRKSETSSEFLEITRASSTNSDRNTGISLIRMPTDHSTSANSNLPLLLWPVPTPVSPRRDSTLMETTCSTPLNRPLSTTRLLLSLRAGDTRSLTPSGPHSKPPTPRPPLERAASQPSTLRSSRSSPETFSLTKLKFVK